MHSSFTDYFVQTVVLFLKRRRAIRILNNLSDHTLKDIGIERYRITAACDALIAKEKEKFARPAKYTLYTTDYQEVLQPRKASRVGN